MTDHACPVASFGPGPHASPKPQAIVQGYAVTNPSAPAHLATYRVEHRIKARPACHSDSPTLSAPPRSPAMGGQASRPVPRCRQTAQARHRPIKSRAGTPPPRWAKGSAAQRWKRGARAEGPGEAQAHGISFLSPRRESNTGIPKREVEPTTQPCGLLVGQGSAPLWKPCPALAAGRGGAAPCCLFLALRLATLMYRETGLRGPFLRSEGLVVVLAAAFPSVVRVEAIRAATADFRPL